MEKDPTPGSSGTYQVQKTQDDDKNKTKDDGKTEPEPTKGISLAVLKKLFTGPCVSEGGFSSRRDWLEYICQDCGLQFSKSNADETDCFFTAVCDQLKRLNKYLDSATQEQYSPHLLRMELVNFLDKNKDNVFEGIDGQINLVDHLDEGDTLTKMKGEDAKVDQVTVIAMALLKKRDITLITCAPDNTLSDRADPMITIPCKTQKSFDKAENILLGYYGNSCFVSLEPFANQIGTHEMSKNIKLMDKENVEGYEQLENDSIEINVEEELAKEPRETVDKQRAKMRKTQKGRVSESLSGKVTSQAKKCGTMIRKTQEGRPYEIRPGMPYYVDNDMEAKPIPSPVFTYEASEGELTVKWQWHNDKRHVATTIHVAGAEFVDRSAVNWCPCKIVHKKRVVDGKQCIWVHNRIDQKESQVIDCLIPFEPYRIFLVDHFRTTMYTDTIERTRSEMMYFTPPPDPIELRVIDRHINEEVMIEWRLTNVRSLTYVDSVELCIQDGKNKNTFRFEKKENGKLQRCFVLKKIKKNIKVNVNVKARVNNEFDKLSDEEELPDQEDEIPKKLSNQVELVIMHSPSVSRPQLDHFGNWEKSEYKEKYFRYKQGSTYYDKFPGKLRKSKIKVVVGMHKLRCGALACYRETNLKGKLVQEDETKKEKNSKENQTRKEENESRRKEEEHMEEEEKRREEEEKRKNEEIKRQNEEIKRKEEANKRREEEESHKRKEEKRKRKEEEKKRERREEEEKRKEEDGKRQSKEEKRIEEEEKRREEEERRKQKEEMRRKKEEKRIEEEVKRKIEEGKRREAEEKRREEEVKRIEEEYKRMRREDERNRAMNRRPKSNGSRTSRKLRGYYRLLYRRQNAVNPGLIYLSPYV